MITKSRAMLTNQSGSVAITTGIVILVLIGFAALGVDIAHMVMVKSQLQKAADAGALAGARGLWPLVLPVKTNDTVTPNCTNGENVAKLATQNNQVDGRPLAYDSEITAQAGRWDYASRTFIPGYTANANGVRVTTRRDGVTMLFAKVLGISTGNLSAASIAVMDYASGVGKGTLPIALDHNVACDSEGNVREGTEITVHMTPDNDDNAGWFVVPPDSAAAATLKDYIDKYSCPALDEGDIINLQNGADASVIAAIKDEFINYHGGTTWCTVVPTVITPKFGQSQPIETFVGLEIDYVLNTTDDKQVHGKLVKLCNISNGLPGGSKGGALAPPKLVR
jgi:Flp pilus assembly protein TadG